MGQSEQAIRQLMKRQLSLVTLEQALRVGMTPGQVRNRTDAGAWVRLHAGVFAAAGSPATPSRSLLAASLAAGPGAAASHLSAAWMLHLIKAPPARPVITVLYERTPALEGVTVHRSRDLDPARLLERQGIPYTDPLRILTDLAGELGAEALTPIVDRALATGMVTTEGLLVEIARRQRRGRRGPTRLLRLLERRGLTGGPEPSVLEAEAMRVFRLWGIPVLGREVHAGSDGRYRIDFLIAPGLAVEVDGYAYHWSPEHKAYDDARRNRLRAAGTTVLVYDWRTVRFEARRMALEVRGFLDRVGAAG